jgi:hypothetical protein
MAASLPKFPSFPVHENNAETRWRKCISRLENLFIGLDNKDKKRQRALLLHYAGEDVNEIFNTLIDRGEDFATAKLKLKEYFAIKKNTEYEVYRFRQAKQSTEETIDSFHTRLRQFNNQFSNRSDSLCNLEGYCLNSQYRKSCHFILWVMLCEFLCVLLYWNTYFFVQLHESYFRC